MDQKLNQYLENLVLQVLGSPSLANLTADQKIALSEKIRNHLHGVIIDTIVDKLNSEQLNTLNNIPADSPEMEDKIEEYAAQIPNLVQELEQKLTQAVENLEEKPQLIS